MVQVQAFNMPTILLSVPGGEVVSPDSMSAGADAGNAVMPAFSLDAADGFPGQAAEDLSPRRSEVEVVAVSAETLAAYLPFLSPASAVAVAPTKPFADDLALADRRAVHQDEDLDPEPDRRAADSRGDSGLMVDKGPIGEESVADHASAGLDVPLEAQLQHDPAPGLQFPALTQSHSETVLPGQTRIEAAAIGPLTARIETVQRAEPPKAPVQPQQVDPEMAWPDANPGGSVSAKTEAILPAHPGLPAAAGLEGTGFVPSASAPGPGGKEGPATGGGMTVTMVPRRAEPVRIPRLESGAEWRIRQFPGPGLATKRPPEAIKEPTPEGKPDLVQGADRAQGPAALPSEEMTPLNGPLGTGDSGRKKPHEPSQEAVSRSEQSGVSAKPPVSTVKELGDPADMRASAPANPSEPVQTRDDPAEQPGQPVLVNAVVERGLQPPEPPAMPISAVLDAELAVPAPQPSETLATTSLLHQAGRTEAPHLAMVGAQGIDPPPRQIALAALSATDGVTELRLSPDELGSVRIEMKTEGDALVMVITAERQDTLDLLRRHSDRLGAEMRSAGFAQLDLSFGRWAGSGPETGGGAGNGFAPARSEQAEPVVAATPSPMRITSRPASFAGGLYLRI